MFGVWTSKENHLLSLLVLRSMTHAYERTDKRHTGESKLCHAVCLYSPPVFLDKIITCLILLHGKYF